MGRHREVLLSSEVLTGLFAVAPGLPFILRPSIT